jgi:hypothetical protein
MPEAAGKKQRKIEREIADFLSELARYLIGAGITFPRFASIARLAYLKAAASGARFRNERLNQSAVAAMTGLTRVQVREFARQSMPAPSETRDRLESVIEGWISDRIFSLSEDSPHKLRLAGAKRSFEALARKYGNDIPPRSLLREMQRHGYVTVRDGHVQLRKRARESIEEVRARRVAQSLAQLVRASVASVPLRTPVRTMNLEITYPAASEAGRRILTEIMQERLQEFMASIQAAGVAVSFDAPHKGTGSGDAITRTRVALISEDLSSQLGTGENE